MCVCLAMLLGCCGVVLGLGLVVVDNVVWAVCEVVEDNGGDLRSLDCLEHS